MELFWTILNGTMLYTPNADFNGQDSFTYTIEDDDAAVSNIATVNITINDINDAPIANADAINTDEDTQVIIDLIGNDTDVDGTVVAGSIVLVTDPINGTAVVNSNGTVNYIPDQDFNGLETFTYTIEDDDGAVSNIAEVTISVNDINDDLVANDDDVTTDEDLMVTIDVLLNDTDPDGIIDPTSVTIITASVNGLSTVNSDGSVLYLPNPDYNGIDVFTYNVQNDEQQVSNIATVNIIVNDINDLPMALNDSIIVEEDLVAILNILENDFDLDGTISGINIVTDPVNGTVGIVGAEVTYSPLMDFTGFDSFTYEISDDDGGISNIATVVVEVRDVNDVPKDLILSNTFIDEVEPIGTLVGSFTTVDVDPDESFTYSLVSGDGSEDNGAFSIFEDRLILQVELDQDQQEFYKIRVKTDDGESSLERSFVITIFSDQDPLFIIPGNLPKYHPVTNAVESYDITVEEGLNVDRVLFNYRGITSPRDAWIIGELTPNNRRYQASIDSSVFDDMGIQYEFIVMDTDGGSINLTGFTYNQYKGEGLDFERIVFGETISDYNMVALPLELDNTGVAEVLGDDLGPYDKTKWRLFTYQGGNLIEYLEGLNSLERGKGYWLIAKDNASINTGPGSTELFADMAFNLHLDKGWTLIGNPYGFNIAWIDVLRDNGVVGKVAVDVIVYEGGYRSSGVLKPFQGGFVFSDEATTLSVPLLKDPTIQGGRIGSSPDINDENNWEVDLNLSTTSLVNNLGGLGMRENADDNKDSYDRVRAPRFLEYLDVNFAKPEYFAPEFSRDIVSTISEYAWDFTAETNLDDAEIIS